MTETELPEISNLKDYQKRESRQSWSTWFQRMWADLPALLNDPEVIAEAGLNTQHESTYNDYLYTYTDGEVKLRAESRTLIYPFQEQGNYSQSKAINGAKVKFIDPVSKTLLVSIPKGAAPQKICILPAAPLTAVHIENSLAAYISRPEKFPAVNRLLSRQASLFSEKNPDTLVKYGDPKVDSIIHRAVNLKQSHFTIQGPPGTGKTYVGARIILELILQGRRVGIMALAHKAIDNLLSAVDRLITLYNVKNCRCYRSKNPDTAALQFNNITTADISAYYQQAHLVAGTVYAFSKLPDGVIDTLVIDEAGQIPLAWIMAAGRTAKNIVLLGDQQQLPQVKQSMHPQDSEKSVLEHLMNEQAIIDPQFGEFLNITRRMNPAITKFISELMYEGRLEAHPSTSQAILNLRSFDHPALDCSGLSWVEMNHKFCSQESREEADEVVKIIRDLQTHQYPLEEVLIITPYRAQEALLRSKLPKILSAQIGTVDRFQGREADIVIFSMTSSDGQHLPRDIDFLFSVNRLNVALSRARKKAIILASNSLLTIPVENLEQLKMINALCRLKKVCRENGLPS